jgi:hypothetical protein
MSISDTFDRVKPSEKIDKAEYHSLFEWERSEE